MPDSSIDAAGDMGCLYQAGMALAAGGRENGDMQHLSGLSGGLAHGNT